ncbi:hypothetical protein MXF21_04785 [Enterococcus casseliflavus]|uniref:hypothetical protein n=2 Tax=Enterococcus casseliflavus TaxID=37734 RepID=UPI002DBB6B61|nr:hypothetical protein [Enterococcus casseliflavus]MEB6085410.1 hypothetical protein [Enterococcus casseliflavus]
MPTLVDKEINKTELHNGSGLMISTIKELFNEIFDKMQYLFIILPLFCLFIMVFSMPENISNHSLIKFIFPNNLVDSLNSELAIYIISFYGFLWIVFFVMAGLRHYFPLLFLNSIFELKRILEAIGSVLMIIIQYMYIYFKVKGISANLIMNKIETIDHPFLFYVGIGMTVMMLLITIMTMVYAPIKD